MNGQYSPVASDQIAEISQIPAAGRTPDLDVHQLKGVRKGTWAVKVSGNWRVTFCFVGRDADQVDYEDYH